MEMIKTDSSFHFIVGNSSVLLTINYPARTYAIYTCKKNDYDFKFSFKKCESLAQSAIWGDLFIAMQKANDFAAKELGFIN